MLILLLCSTTLGFAQKLDPFTIKDKQITITLELENKATAIELYKETKFRFILKNIDIKKTSIVGRGIRIQFDENATDTNSIQCTTTVDEEALVNGKYQILFNYKNGSAFKTYRFILPVKR